MKVLLVGGTPICTECGYVMRCADRIVHETGAVTVLCGTFECGNYWKSVSVTFPIVDAPSVYPEGM